MKFRGEYPRLLLFPIILVILSFDSGFGQVQAGAPFLKMLPGARLQSMGSAQTSGLDELHSIFANPGTAGLTREWYWAASYSKWIADVYNASLILGKNYRTPWSRKTRFSVGLIYHGMPEFDSTDETVPIATANDIIATLTIGQPLSYISDNLAVGTSFKYLRSTLDEFHANAWIADIGLVGRTPRFDLGNSLLEHGVISLGVAFNHMGQDLTYEHVATPLPQTWRVGAAFYAGTHGGVQLQVLADFYNVKDEEGALGIGAEVSWSKRFSINGGYDFGGDLMSKVSFGATICLDDVMTSEQTLLPGRNNALQLDMATIDEGEFFSRTYRGTMSHYPIGPEHFRFANPANGDTVKTESVIFKWETSRDPDIFDQVRYRLVLDQDSTKLAQLLSFYDAKQTDKFYAMLSETNFCLNEPLETDSFIVSKPIGGDNYWMVIAEDLDQHLTFAETEHSRIARFYIPYPDLKIEKIEFDYHRIITEDDYHGDLKIYVTNTGDLTARDFTVTIYDSSVTVVHDLSDGKETKLTRLHENQFAELRPGQSETIQIPWNTLLLGSHRICAVVDTEEKIKELNKINNSLSENFTTIPKGTFACDDTVAVVTIAQVTIDMPIITEVCFDINSARVKNEYLHKTSIDPPVATLAKRLAGHRELKITLQGFADTNSGETDVELANARTEAVRDSLILLGVNDNQIQTIEGQVLPKRRIPKNPQDAYWVFEERRYVAITTDAQGQAILFLPIRHTDNEEIRKQVIFKSAIKSAAQTSAGQLFLSQDMLQDSLELGNLQYRMHLDDEMAWDPARTGALAAWINKDIDYNIHIKDELGREFHTRDRKAFLNQTTFVREHRIAFPLQFAGTSPMYSFYWSRLLDITQKMLDTDKHMHFEGHACAVGPEEINDMLSKQRANRFHDGFISHVKKEAADFYQTMANKISPAQGFGEVMPLGITRLSGERILIGDNQSPIGRKLNRRIEIVFSMEMEGVK